MSTVCPLIILKAVFFVTNKKVWLVAELEDTCRDNGYHFFKYMRKERSSHPCYYAINKSSEDFHKIKDLGNIIQFGSIKYWLLYMSANKNIVTDKGADPCHLLFVVLHKLGSYDNIIYLQHGIMFNDIPMFYYKNTHFRLITSGSKAEYKLLRGEKYCYPENRVKYTGFARYDNLADFRVNSRQILIMPTWRRWLGREVNKFGEKVSFTDSTYYKKWSEILKDESLIKYIEKENLVIKFFPHHQMQKFIKNFKTPSKNIQILSEGINDVQELLKESAILITDYSSVVFDFAYMKKPILYYQFDINELLSKHFQNGKINYEDNDLGLISYTKDELLTNLKKFHTKFILPTKYSKRVEDMFFYRDNKNCERIYNEIIKI